MKGQLVKEIKAMGVRKVNGKKLESYTFYELVNIYAQVKAGKVEHK